jgi:hypothetical protein
MEDTKTTKDKDKCVTFDDPGWDDPLDSKMTVKRSTGNDTSWSSPETAICYSFLPGPGGRSRFHLIALHSTTIVVRQVGDPPLIC